jgi:hypothetical protein
VRGLGEWPHWFNQAPILSRTRVVFGGPATHPGPSPGLSPQEAGRGEYHSAGALAASSAATSPAPSVSAVARIRLSSWVSEVALAIGAVTPGR